MENSLGNTTKEKVVEVLKNCAVALKVDNFVVDTVVSLTKDKTLTQDPGR